MVARGVNFGMAVAYMISTEQRTIETVAAPLLAAAAEAAGDARHIEDGRSPEGSDL